MAGGFEELGLASELLRAVKDDLGYLLPTDVQDEAIPLILGGGDVMVAAETGSGKTAAFSLPLLQIVHEDLRLREGAESVRENSVDGLRAERRKGGWRISETDKDLNVAVSADGLACQSREPTWVGARGQNGVRGGVHCFEGIVDDEGICRFGWATRGANFNLGTDAFGYGFGSTGMKSHRGQFEKYGEPFAKGDSVGCRLDLVKGEVSFSKNGHELGVAFHVPAGSRTERFFPAVAFKNAQASFNFSTCSVGSGDAIPLASASPQHAVIDCSKNSSVRTPRAIILEPARELAEQVSDCLSTLKQHFTSPRLEHALLVGGTDRKPIMSLLKRSCDVVVGTPGRILDFVEKGFLDCSAVRLLIVDEADRLLVPDSRAQLMKIYMRLPHGGVGNLKLQIGFFSATLHSPEIAELSEIICDRPTWVDLKGRDVVPDAVQHVVVRVDPDGDAARLVAATATVHVRTGKTAGFGSDGREEQRSERLKRLKPQVLLGIVQALAMDQAMLFCRTNLDCDILEDFLTEAGGGNRSSSGREGGKENAFSCRVLSGMRPTNQRRANLQAFKDGHVRFLVCTDVAARGVDVKGLAYVVNMTLPDELENYIHRVGRVGRQGCQGVAVSIVACEELKEKVWYHTCPNRGRNCTNRATLTEGGCTTWFDEPSKLKAIEKHLGAPIAELGPGYSLPAATAPQPSGAAIPLEDRVKPRGGGAGTDIRERMSAHVEMLRPTVRELARLEFEAQNNWLGMVQGRF